MLDLVATMPDRFQLTHQIEECKQREEGDQHEQDRTADFQRKIFLQDLHAAAFRPRQVRLSSDQATNG
ncbi:hypothetical protein D3C81_2181990 [compost metagenome]